MSTSLDSAACAYCHQPMTSKPTFDCRNPAHTGAADWALRGAEEREEHSDANSLDYDWALRGGEERTHEEQSKPVTATIDLTRVVTEENGWPVSRAEEIADCLRKVVEHDIHRDMHPWRDLVCLRLAEQFEEQAVPEPWVWREYGTNAVACAHGVPLGEPCDRCEEQEPEETNDNASFGR